MRLASSVWNSPRDFIIPDIISVDDLRNLRLARGLVICGAPAKTLKGHSCTIHEAPLIKCGAS